MQNLQARLGAIESALQKVPALRRTVRSARQAAATQPVIPIVASSSGSTVSYAALAVALVGAAVAMRSARRGAVAAASEKAKARQRKCPEGTTKVMGECKRVKTPADCLNVSEKTFDKPDATRTACISMSEEERTEVCESMNLTYYKGECAPMLDDAMCAAQTPKGEDPLFSWVVDATTNFTACRALTTMEREEACLSAGRAWNTSRSVCLRPIPPPLIRPATARTSETGRPNQLKLQVLNTSDEKRVLLPELAVAEKAGAADWDGKGPAPEGWKVLENVERDLEDFECSGAKCASLVVRDLKGQTPYKVMGRLRGKLHPDEASPYSPAAELSTACPKKTPKACKGKYGPDDDTLDVPASRRDPAVPKWPFHKVPTADGCGCEAPTGGNWESGGQPTDRWMAEQGRRLHMCREWFERNRPYSKPGALVLTDDTCRRAARAVDMPRGTLLAAPRMGGGDDAYYHMTLQWKLPETSEADRPSAYAVYREADASQRMKVADVRAAELKPNEGGFVTWNDTLKGVRLPTATDTEPRRLDYSVTAVNGAGEGEAVEVSGKSRPFFRSAASCGNEPDNDPDDCLDGLQCTPKTPFGGVFYKTSVDGECAPLDAAVKSTMCATLSTRKPDLKSVLFVYDEEEGRCKPSDKSRAAPGTPQFSVESEDSGSFTLTLLPPEDAGTPPFTSYVVYARMCLRTESGWDCASSQEEQGVQWEETVVTRGRKRATRHRVNEVNGVSLKPGDRCSFYVRAGCANPVVWWDEPEVQGTQLKLGLATRPQDAQTQYATPGVPRNVLAGQVTESTISLNILEWVGDNGGLPGDPVEYRIERRLVRGGYASSSVRDVMTVTEKTTTLKLCAGGKCPQAADGTWKVVELASGYAWVDLDVLPWTGYQYRVQASNGQGFRFAVDPANSARTFRTKWSETALLSVRSSEPRPIRATPVPDQYPGEDGRAKPYLPDPFEWYEAPLQKSLVVHARNAVDVVFRWKEPVDPNAKRYAKMFQKEPAVYQVRIQTAGLVREDTVTGVTQYTVRGKIGEPIRFRLKAEMRGHLRYTDGREATTPTRCQVGSSEPGGWSPVQATFVPELPEDNKLVVGSTTLCAVDAEGWEDADGPHKQGAFRYSVFDGTKCRDWSATDAGRFCFYDHNAKEPHWYDSETASCQKAVNPKYTVDPYEACDTGLGCDKTQQKQRVFCAVDKALPPSGSDYYWQQKEGIEFDASHVSRRKVGTVVAPAQVESMTLACPKEVAVKALETKAVTLDGLSHYSSKSCAEDRGCREGLIKAAAASGDPALESQNQECMMSSCFDALDGGLCGFCKKTGVSYAVVDDGNGNYVMAYPGKCPGERGKDWFMDRDQCCPQLLEDFKADTSSCRKQDRVWKKTGRTRARPGNRMKSESVKWANDGEPLPGRCWQSYLGPFTDSVVVGDCVATGSKATATLYLNGDASFHTPSLQPSDSVYREIQVSAVPGPGLVRYDIREEPETPEVRGHYFPGKRTVTFGGQTFSTRGWRLLPHPTKLNRHLLEVKPGVYLNLHGSGSVSTNRGNDEAVHWDGWRIRRGNDSGRGIAHNRNGVMWMSTNVSGPWERWSYLTWVRRGEYEYAVSTVGHNYSNHFAEARGVNAWIADPEDEEELQFIKSLLPNNTWTYLGYRYAAGKWRRDYGYGEVTQRQWRGPSKVSSWSEAPEAWYLRWDPGEPNSSSQTYVTVRRDVDAMHDNIGTSGWPAVFKRRVVRVITPPNPGYPMSQGRIVGSFYAKPSTGGGKLQKAHYLQLGTGVNGQPTDWRMRLINGTAKRTQTWSPDKQFSDPTRIPRNAVSLQYRVYVEAYVLANGVKPGTEVTVDAFHNGPTPSNLTFSYEVEPETKYKAALGSQSMEWTQPVLSATERDMVTSPVRNSVNVLEGQDDVDTADNGNVRGQRIGGDTGDFAFEPYKPDAEDRCTFPVRLPERAGGTVEQTSEKKGWSYACAGKTLQGDGTCMTRLDGSDGAAEQACSPCPGMARFGTLDEAMASCDANPDCGGLQRTMDGQWETRTGISLAPAAGRDQSGYLFGATAYLKPLSVQRRKGTIDIEVVAERTPRSSRVTIDGTRVDWTSAAPRQADVPGSGRGINILVLHEMGFNVLERRTFTDGESAKLAAFVEGIQGERVVIVYTEVDGAGALDLARARAAMESVGVKEGFKLEPNDRFALVGRKGAGEMPKGFARLVRHKEVEAQYRDTTGAPAKVKVTLPVSCVFKGTPDKCREDCWATPGCNAVMCRRQSGECTAFQGSQYEQTSEPIDTWIVDRERAWDGFTWKKQKPAEMGCMDTEWNKVWVERPNCQWSGIIGRLQRIQDCDEFDRAFKAIDGPEFVKMGGRVQWLKSLREEKSRTCTTAVQSKPNDSTVHFEYQSRQLLRRPDGTVTKKMPETDRTAGTTVTVLHPTPQDMRPLKWEGAKELAQSMGGRLPTPQEVAKAAKEQYAETADTWVPTEASDGTADYTQIAKGESRFGKTHMQAHRSLLPVSYKNRAYGVWANRAFAIAYDTSVRDAVPGAAWDTTGVSLRALRPGDATAGVAFKIGGTVIFGLTSRPPVPLDARPRALRLVGQTWARPGWRREFGEVDISSNFSASMELRLVNPTNGGNDPRCTVLGLDPFKVSILQGDLLALEGPPTPGLHKLQKDVVYTVVVEVDSAHERVRINGKLVEERPRRTRGKPISRPYMMRNDGTNVDVRNVVVTRTDAAPQYEHALLADNGVFTHEGRRVGTYAKGDAVAVVLDRKGRVQFQRNSRAFFTSPLRATYPLYFVAELRYAGDTLEQVQWVSAPRESVEVEVTTSLPELCGKPDGSTKVTYRGQECRDGQVQWLTAESDPAQAPSCRLQRKVETPRIVDAPTTCPDGFDSFERSSGSLACCKRDADGTSGLGGDGACTNDACCIGQSCEGLPRCALQRPHAGSLTCPVGTRPCSADEVGGVPRGAYRIENGQEALVSEEGVHVRDGASSAAPGLCCDGNAAWNARWFGTCGRAPQAFPDLPTTLPRRTQAADGRACIFPFKRDGKVHDACDSDGRCATRTDDDGNALEMAPCLSSETCPRKGVQEGTERCDTSDVRAVARRAPAKLRVRGVRIRHAGHLALRDVQITGGDGKRVQGRFVKATQSSDFSGDTGAQNAIDGSEITEARTRGGTQAEWWQVDLGRAVTSPVTVTVRTPMRSQQYVKRLELSGSGAFDGEWTWRPLRDRYMLFPAYEREGLYLVCEDNGYGNANWAIVDPGHLRREGKPEQLRRRAVLANPYSKRGNQSTMKAANDEATEYLVAPPLDTGDHEWLEEHRRYRVVHHRNDGGYEFLMNTNEDARGFLHARVKVTVQTSSQSGSGHTHSYLRAGFKADGTWRDNEPLTRGGRWSWLKPKDGERVTFYLTMPPGATHMRVETYYDNWRFDKVWLEDKLVLDSTLDVNRTTKEFPLNADAVRAAEAAAKPARSGWDNHQLWRDMKDAVAAGEKPILMLTTDDGRIQNAHGALDREEFQVTDVRHHNWHWYQMTMRRMNDNVKRYLNGNNNSHPYDLAVYVTWYRPKRFRFRVLEARPPTVPVTPRNQWVRIAEKVQGPRAPMSSRNWSLSFDLRFAKRKLPWDWKSIMSKGDDALMFSIYQHPKSTRIRFEVHRAIIDTPELASDGRTHRFRFELVEFNIRLFIDGKFFREQRVSDASSYQFVKRDLCGAPLWMARKAGSVADVELRNVVVTDMSPQATALHAPVITYYDPSWGAHGHTWDYMRDRARERKARLPTADELRGVMHLFPPSGDAWTATSDAGHADSNRKQWVQTADTWMEGKEHTRVYGDYPHSWGNRHNGGWKGHGRTYAHAHDQTAPVVELLDSDGTVLASQRLGMTTPVQDTHTVRFEGREEGAPLPECLSLVRGGAPCELQPECTPRMGKACAGEAAADNPDWCVAPKPLPNSKACYQITNRGQCCSTKDSRSGYIKDSACAWNEDGWFGSTTKCWALEYVRRRGSTEGNMCATASDGSSSASCPALERERFDTYREPNMSSKRPSLGCWNVDGRAFVDGGDGRFCDLERSVPLRKQLRHGPVWDVANDLSTQTAQECRELCLRSAACSGGFFRSGSCWLSSKRSESAQPCDRCTVFERGATDACVRVQALPKGEDGKDRALIDSREYEGTPARMCLARRRELVQLPPVDGGAVSDEVRTDGRGLTATVTGLPRAQVRVVSRTGEELVPWTDLKSGELDVSVPPTDGGVVLESRLHPDVREGDLVRRTVGKTLTDQHRVADLCMAEYGAPACTLDTLTEAKRRFSPPTQADGCPVGSHRFTDAAGRLKCCSQEPSGTSCPGSACAHPDCVNCDGVACIGESEALAFAQANLTVRTGGCGSNTDCAAERVEVKATQGAARAACCPDRAVRWRDVRVSSCQ